ncbi:hypothetical protein BC940DRAFT_302812 [Gongronella butleri]|nr:hypothetical protein BC940DRAFT_302812 [Gongronella butleri]
MTSPSYRQSAHDEHQVPPPPPPPRDYFNLNKDEAEAGSILMSLSQQPPSAAKPSNSMAISNLLGGNEHDEPTNRSQTVEIQKFETLSMNEDMHRQPETAMERPAMYAERQTQSYRQEKQPAHPASVASTMTRHRSHSLTSPSDAYPSHPNFATYTPPPGKQTYYAMPQQAAHPAAGNAATAYHRHYDRRPSYSQQSYQSMRNNPKIRRNALHAYISYMTYSDLVKQNINRLSPRPGMYTQPSSHAHGSPSLLKQPVTPLPTSMDRMVPMASGPGGVTPGAHPHAHYAPHAQHHHHPHHPHHPPPPMQTPPPQPPSHPHPQQQPQQARYAASPPPAPSSSSPPQPLTAFLKHSTPTTNVAVAQTAPTPSPGVYGHTQPQQQQQQQQQQQRFSYPRLPDVARLPHPDGFYKHNG